MAVAVAIWLLSATGADAHHDGVHEWIDPNGGAWVDPNNWDPSALPFADDTARFGLVDETYTVGFGFLGNPLDVETFLLFISEGDVTFNLNQSAYTVGPSSIIIGEGSHTVGSPIGILVPNTASLSIEDGLVVANTVVLGFAGLSIPFFQPNRGTLNVSGSDAELQIDGGSLIVGERGTGTLNLTDGGVLREAPGVTDDVNVLIGRFDTAFGTVNVDGVTTDFFQPTADVVNVSVGHEGQGALNITNGGRASVDSVSIAALPGSSGTVLVDGDPNNFPSGLGRQVYVGGTSDAAGGEGELTIQNGGQVNGGAMKIWDHGLVTLDGGHLIVNGLDIEPGGTFDWPSGELEFLADLNIGTGEILGDDLTVGAGRHLHLTTNSGQLTSLNIESTGRLSLEGGIVELGGLAELNIAPGGTFDWTSGTLIMRGGLDVDPQGPLGDNLTIGDDMVLQVPAPVFFVGSADGPGTINVTGTGKAFGSTSIRSSDGVASSVLVSGPDAQWGGSVTVGSFSDPDTPATMTVEGGATAGGNVIVGQGASSGILTLTGEETLWHAEGLAPDVFPSLLYVGRSGTGTLVISDGAEFVMTNASDLTTFPSSIGTKLSGNAPLGIGTMTVDGEGSRFESDGPLLVGNEGTGELHVTDMGRIALQSLRIAEEEGSSGTVTVSGGSRIDVLGDEIFVGVHGIGTMEVSQGAAVATDATVVVGGFSMEQETARTLTIRDPQSRFDIGVSLNVSTSSGAPAVVTIADGATAAVGQNVFIREKGTLNLNGGTLYARTIDHTYGGQFNFTSGRLEVTEFLGNLNNPAGTLAPGASPAIATISESYFQGDDATLEIELEGYDNSDPMNAQFDVMDVGEVASLGGTLDVLFPGGFQPELGDMFEILTAGDFVAGQFDTLLAPVFGGLTFDVVYGPQNVTLEVIEATLVLGDYNQNGTVDAADYTIWRDTLGSTTNLAADGDASGTVDAADYNLWRSNFGMTAAVGAASRAARNPAHFSGRNNTVPEPASLVWVGIAGIALFSFANVSCARYAGRHGRRHADPVGHRPRRSTRR